MHKSLPHPRNTGQAKKFMTSFSLTIHNQFEDRQLTIVNCLSSFRDNYFVYKCIRVTSCCIGGWRKKAGNTVNGHKLNFYCIAFLPQK